MSVNKFKASILRPYFYEKDFNLLNKNVLLGLIEALISPIFGLNDEIFIAYNLLNEEVLNVFEKKYSPRLKFQNVKIFNDFDSSLNPVEFLIISTKQYSACVMFDFSLSENKEEAVFCSYFNSKKIEEILKIVLPDEKFFPERRENIELNNAFLNLVKYSDNSLKELSINEIEKNNLEKINQIMKKDEYLAKKSRYISHEIKNHLSIIDVYSKVIEKTCENNSKIINATKIMNNSVQSITKLLNSLKTFADIDMNLYPLNALVSEVVDNTKELLISNGINILVDFDKDVNVVLDKDKFQNVLLNLIKNAMEALKDSDKPQKNIEVSTRLGQNQVSVFVKNNGNKIEKNTQEKIFEEGFTTKNYGSGLGLFICKQTLAEQFCELSLLKSTSAMTVFEIKMNYVS